jgi:hypothetical protein
MWRFCASALWRSRENQFSFNGITMENNENNQQKRPKNRAVYGFRKNYPGSTGGSDYSIGESRKLQNRARRNKVYFAVLLLVVFCFSFVATATAIKLSNRPVRDSGTADEKPVKVAATLGNMRGMWFSSDVFSSEQDVKNMIKKIKASGADTAVIEFKTPDGDLCYESILQAAKNAYATSGAYPFVGEYIEMIKAENIRVFALVSCFEDNKAATVIPDAAVKTGTLTLWAHSVTSRAWLNPYSDIARGYLTELISEMGGLGVDGFVLTAVQFPVADNDGSVMYSGETSLTDRNAALKQFITEAIEAAGEREVIIGVSFDAAFGADLRGCGGNILDSRARYYAPDFRAASQTTEVLFGDTLYSGSNFADYSFVSTYYSELVKQQTENIFVPICDDADYSVKALEDAGSNAFILE